MLFQKFRFFCLLVLILSFLIPATANATSLNSFHQQAAADFPAVDPNYIYDQLYYMVTHFQRREAGYDNNLPVNVNGHDEFAAYWAQEMQRNLTGFGAQVSRDEFTINGWQGRPATVPAFNVEVAVPGVADRPPRPCPHAGWANGPAHSHAWSTHHSPPFLSGPAGSGRLVQPRAAGGAR